MNDLGLFISNNFGGSVSPSPRRRSGVHSGPQELVPYFISREKKGEWIYGYV